MAAAPEVLLRLDADEDEVVSLDELLGKPAAANPFPARVFPANPAQPAPPNVPGLFLMASVGGDAAELPGQLLQRYGKGAETLTRIGLGLDQQPSTGSTPTATAAGRYEELAHFAERPAGPGAEDSARKAVAEGGDGRGDEGRQGRVAVGRHGFAG